MKEKPARLGHQRIPKGHPNGVQLNPNPIWPSNPKPSADLVWFWVWPVEVHIRIGIRPNLVKYSNISR